MLIIRHSQGKSCRKHKNIIELTAKNMVSLLTVDFGRIYYETIMEKNHCRNVNDESDLDNIRLRKADGRA